MEKKDRFFIEAQNEMFEVYDRYKEGCYVRILSNSYVLFPNGEKETLEGLIDDTLITRLFSDLHCFELDLLEFDFEGTTELKEITVSNEDDSYIGVGLREQNKFIIAVRDRFLLFIEISLDGLEILTKWRKELEKYT